MEGRACGNGKSEPRTVIQMEWMAVSCTKLLTTETKREWVEIIFGGTSLAQLVGRVTLDLRGVSSSPILG